MVEAHGPPGPGLGGRRLRAAGDRWPPAAGCAPRATRSRAAPRRSTSTWWPSACSACRIPKVRSERRWRTSAATTGGLPGRRSATGWRPTSPRRWPSDADGRSSPSCRPSRRRRTARGLAQGHGRQGLGHAAPGRRSTAAAGCRREQARVLAEEMARVGARNPIGGMGVMLFGPTLLEYGTEALKQRALPGHRQGDVRWCQGYSEPGAGLRPGEPAVPAEDKGDHFLVNGSEDLDQRRAARRPVLLPGADRHGQEARGHQLPADRHEGARASRRGRSC